MGVEHVRTNEDDCLIYVSKQEASPGKWKERVVERMRQSKEVLPVLALDDAIEAAICGSPDIDVAACFCCPFSATHQQQSGSVREPRSQRNTSTLQTSCDYGGIQEQRQLVSFVNLLSSLAEKLIRFFKIKAHSVPSFCGYHGTCRKRHANLL